MDALELDVRRQCVRGVEVAWEILPIGNADIRSIGICADGVSRRRVCDDERLNVVPFVLGQPSQPDAAGCPAVQFLDCANHKDLADQTLAVVTLERTVEGSIRDAALVDLDIARRSLYSSSPAVLYDPRPCPTFRARPALRLPFSPHSRVPSPTAAYLRSGTKTTLTMRNACSDHSPRYFRDTGRLTPAPGNCASIQRRRAPAYGIDRRMFP